jgi:hypothetical protein
MPSIRVQIGAMPQLLGDMVVQLLGARAAVEVAGRTAAGEDPLAQARDSGANLLVVLDEPQSSPCLDAVLTQPRLSILALSGSGERGELVRFRRQGVPLDRGLAAAVAELD